MRYDYATYRTLERANDALEDMFAAGEVCEGESPRVERRVHKTASWSKAITQYVVTLEDWS